VSESGFELFTTFCSWPIVGALVDVVQARRRLRRFLNVPVSVADGRMSSNARSTTCDAGQVCSENSCRFWYDALSSSFHGPRVCSIASPPLCRVFRLEYEFDSALSRLEYPPDSGSYCCARVSDPLRVSEGL
jgi:hypothetical protein